MVQELFTPTRDPRPGVSLEAALVAAQNPASEWSEQPKPAATAKYKIQVGAIVGETETTFKIYHPEGKGDNFQHVAKVGNKQITATKLEQWEAAKNDPAFQAALIELQGKSK